MDEKLNFVEAFSSEKCERFSIATVEHYEGTSPKPCHPPSSPKSGQAYVHCANRIRTYPESLSLLLRLSRNQNSELEGDAIWRNQIMLIIM